MDLTSSCSRPPKALARFGFPPLALRRRLPQRYVGVSIENVYGIR